MKLLVHVGYFVISVFVLGEIVHPEGSWFLAMLGAAVFFAILSSRRRIHRRMHTEVENIANELSAAVGAAFSVESCPRCYESEMRILSVSQSARSIKYRCVNCDEERFAPARSAYSSSFLAIAREFETKSEEYGRRFSTPLAVQVTFSAPRDGLPHEVRSSTETSP